MILTNPTPKILEEELPVMVQREGISSVKLYMTYPAMKLGDRDMLEVMLRCRELGCTVMVHAENSDMIDMYAPVSLSLAPKFSLPADLVSSKGTQPVRRC